MILRGYAFSVVISRFYLYTIVFLLAALGYLYYRIISPFLNSIAWAAVFSILFYPVYLYIVKHMKMRNAASIITLMLILLTIFVPFTYLTVLLIDEVREIVAFASHDGMARIRDIFERPRVASFLGKILSVTGTDTMSTEELIRQNISKIGSGLIESLTVRIPNILSTGIDFIIMAFTIFFLLRDGPGFLAKAKEYLPFRDDQKDKLEKQIKDMIVSTVYGGVTVAVIQGLLGGFAFYFLDIGSPVVWGMAMSVMSFVPFLGPFSIWGSHTAYLIMQGQYLKGAGLFLFGFFVISMVDNILKPVIIGNRTKMHTLIIFFSVLGGIKLFGLIGLILGPLITAIFLSVIEIFRNIEGGQNAES